MRTIITGKNSHRPSPDDLAKIDTLHMLIGITDVITSHRIGVEVYSEEWADWNDIPITWFLPEFRKYGKDKAETINRIAMIEYAEVLVMFSKDSHVRELFDFAIRKKLQIHDWSVNKN